MASNPMHQFEVYRIGPEIKFGAINLSFTKGEDNLAGDAMGMLREKGFNPVQKETIHANTLKSFISKGLEQGIPMELDLLGAYVRNEAKIGRKV